jgi:predicted nucleic acid-binding protein
MTVVCDMGPLHYLVLIGCDHVLPAMFDRVLTARVVVEKEMSDPGTPEPVRLWASNPPQWLEVRDPKHVEDIPSLGRAGERGDGDRAVISLALEERADFVLMDDNKARKQVVAKGKEHGQVVEPLWTLEVLDEAAERGLIGDLPERLAALEHQTPFYVGEKARRVIEGMLRRDLQRKETQEADRTSPERTGPGQEPTAEHKPKHRRGRGRGR